MVIWLIGMSASGKTTIGQKLYDKLSMDSKRWVFIDGDTFRSLFGDDLGHDIESRRKNAFRLSAFCRYLNNQDVNVLACVLSIFHDNQRYNKENIAGYKEVFIDVNFDNLIKRDNKNIYKDALSGKIKDVVGVDIDFLPPCSPDLVIDNNSSPIEVEVITKKIMDAFEIHIEEKYTYTSKNLLNYPQKYQYSKFDESSFVGQFKRDRNDALQFFHRRLLKVQKHYSNCCLMSEVFECGDDFVLKNFLLFLKCVDIDILQEYKKTILKLVKRFEVSKRLYTTYDKLEIKKSSDVYDELSNYPLFGIVLQKLYHECDNEEKLILFNTIVKLNDIVSSIKSEFLFSEEIQYAIDSISGELNILKEYV